jgi:hypothetical protein
MNNYLFKTGLWITGSFLVIMLIVVLVSLKTNATDYFDNKEKNKQLTDVVSIAFPKPTTTYLTKPELIQMVENLYIPTINIMVNQDDSITLSAKELSSYDKWHWAIGQLVQQRNGVVFENQELCIGECVGQNKLLLTTKVKQIRLN